jgi:uncharacterized protein (UPF0276 family)
MMMKTTSDALSAIPFLGSGLGYRRELRPAILEAQSSIDFVEIVAEHFMNDPVELTELEELRAIFPVIPHGIGLSIGSAAPLDYDYLQAVRQVCAITGASYFSEHLALTRVPGINIGHLSPLWFTEPVLANTIANVHRVQEYLGLPLILENVTYAFEIPNATMSQAEFFLRLVEATGCGILLDVTNVHVNSVNHRFDPIAFLRDMPLDRVVQIHLAGGFWKDDVLVDGHSEPVDDASWSLLETLVDMTFIRGCILEQDDNFDEPIRLVEQVNRARRIVQNGLATRSTRTAASA